MSFAAVVLLGWIPICAMLFALCRPVRAVTLAYLLGWLLLPVVAVPIEGFWDLDKVLATNAGVLIGTVLFQRGRLLRFSPGVPELLLLGFAATAFVSSLTNDLGIYDGLSSATRTLLFYAAPFVFGRLYIRSREDLYQSARIIVIGTALYALPALWEWRMSPQLHRIVYGVHQHELITMPRFGFFRSVVFFPMTLALGSFFAWTSLVGIALWRERRMSSVLGLPPSWIVALPVLGLVTTMSAGPMALFVCGLVLMRFARAARGVLYLPLLFAAFWMIGRYTGVTDGEWLVEAAQTISEERADSLEYRVNAETLLLDRAKERPWFGWGGWGRHRIRDEESGRDLVATDGLWIVLVGIHGLAGLALFYLWWCWPIVGNGAARLAARSDMLVAAVLVSIGLEAVNFLFNGFLSPVLMMMCGGVLSRLAPVLYPTNIHVTVGGTGRRPRRDRASDFLKNPMR